MHSRTFLRAGLVSLTFALCALFASAMPVPPCSEINPRSCLVSKPDPGVAISKHSGEDYNIVTRSSISHADHLALREVIVSRTSVKEKFKKFGQKLKAGFQKVGQGIKTAAKKVGRFVKTTGAKIVKFGAKVVSTGMSVLSKVAKVIPGVGKAISAGLKGVGTAADVVSNAIHANLGKKLDKGMKIMDKVQNPIKGAGGAVLDAVLKRDLGDSKNEVLSREWISRQRIEKRNKNSKKVKNTVLPDVDPNKPSAVKQVIENTKNRVIFSAPPSVVQAKLGKGMPMLDNGQNPVPTESGAMRSALGNRDLDDSEIEVLAREWDKFEEHDEELYEFEARDGSHNWEAREWNDWEERGWDQWDARDWEGQYAL